MTLRWEMLTRLVAAGTFGQSFCLLVASPAASAVLPGGVLVVYDGRLNSPFSAVWSHPSFYSKHYVGPSTTGVCTCFRTTAHYRVIYTPYVFA